MDERELRAFHRAAQPILQRTAPTAKQERVQITPPVLDQIAWGVVLVYIAHAGQPAPAAISRQVRSGEGPLRDEDIRAMLDSLKRPAVRSRLQPQPGSMNRFGAAVRRLLEAYGWAPQHATQAADEVAAALQAVTR